MALRGLDSGEATRFPTYAAPGIALLAWAKRANQPSKWELYTNDATTVAGFQTTGAYTGTTVARLRTNSTAARSIAMRRTFGAALASSYTSIMVNVSQLESYRLLELWSAAGTTSVRIMINALGQILIYAGTGATLKATIAAGWAANEWHQIRIHQDTATNTLEVKLDNNALVDCSGTAMLAWQYLVLGTTTTLGIDLSWYFDCIQINDTTGSVNNSWPGTPRIPTATRPTADDGAATDWVRSSGSNDFDMIKEVQPDLDTTYVHSETFGDKSLYSFGALGEPTNTVIDAVVLTIVAKRADAAKIIPVVYRGGTTVELTAVDVGVDYMTPIEVIIETDPIAGGGTAWTQANLDATEFGFKHAAP